MDGGRSFTPFFSLASQGRRERLRETTTSLLGVVGPSFLFFVLPSHPFFWFLLLLLHLKERNLFFPRDVKPCAERVRDPDFFFCSVCYRWWDLIWRKREWESGSRAVARKDSAFLLLTTFPNLLHLPLLSQNVLFGIPIDLVGSTSCQILPGRTVKIPRLGRFLSSRWFLTALFQDLWDFYFPEPHSCLNDFLATLFLGTDWVLQCWLELTSFLDQELSWAPSFLLSSDSSCRRRRCQSTIRSEIQGDEKGLSFFLSLWPSKDVVVWNIERRTWVTGERLSQPPPPAAAKRKQGRDVSCLNQLL